MQLQSFNWLSANEISTINIAIPRSINKQTKQKHDHIVWRNGGCIPCSWHGKQLIGLTFSFR